VLGMLNRPFVSVLVQRVFIKQHLRASYIPAYFFDMDVQVTFVSFALAISWRKEVLSVTPCSFGLPWRSNEQVRTTPWGVRR